MNIVDRLEYSNIQEYRIGDTECENLVLKALQCGIGNIVIGSSALDLVSDMLEKENNDDIKINTVADAVEVPLRESGSSHQSQRIA